MATPFKWGFFTRPLRPSPDMIEMLEVRTLELGYDPAKLEFPEQFHRTP